MSIKIDQHSQTWLNIREYVESRMAAIRTQLEANISHEETMQLRAKLQELKSLMGETQIEAPLLDVEEYMIPG